MEILKIFVFDFLGSAPILVGLMALLGLILQKKRPEKIISGTLKTIVGFLIFGCGTGISSFPGAVSGLIVFTAVTADSFPLPSFGAAFSVFSFFCSFLSVFFSSAGKRSKREVSSKSGFCDIANSHLSEYKSIISWIGGRGNCF